MNHIEAMKLALEFADDVFRGNYKGNADEVITALRQAIEQAEQAQPVAWVYEFYADMGHKGLAFEPQRSAYNIPLYTSPPPRQPLTEERLELIGHADPTINNIYVFNGYGERVPEGRTPIYAGYKAAHGIMSVPDGKGEA